MERRMITQSTATALIMLCSREIPFRAFTGVKGRLQTIQKVGMLYRGLGACNLPSGSLHKFTSGVWAARPSAWREPSSDQKSRLRMVDNYCLRTESDNHSLRLHVHALSVCILSYGALGRLESRVES